MPVPKNIVQPKTLGFASVTDEKERHENMENKGYG